MHFFFLSGYLHDGNFKYSLKQLCIHIGGSHTGGRIHIENLPKIRVGSIFNVYIHIKN